MVQCKKAQKHSQKIWSHCAQVTCCGSTRTANWLRSSEQTKKTNRLIFFSSESTCVCVFSSRSQTCLLFVSCSFFFLNNCTDQNRTQHRCLTIFKKEKNLGVCSLLLHGKRSRRSPVAARCIFLGRRGGAQWRNESRRCSGSV